MWHVGNLSFPRSPHLWQVGNIAGQILLNGTPRCPMFKRVSAYVMQFDALFETLTVRDDTCHLPYMADVRDADGARDARKQAI